MMLGTAGSSLMSRGLISIPPDAEDATESDDHSNAGQFWGKAAFEAVSFLFDLGRKSSSPFRIWKSDQKSLGRRHAGSAA